MSDLGNAHPSEAFRVGRQVKSTRWIQCGQDLMHEKDAQPSLQRTKKDGTEMVGLRAQTMRDAQGWGLTEAGEAWSVERNGRTSFSSKRVQFCWNQPGSSGKGDCNSQHRIQPQKERETANPCTESLLG